MGDEERLRGRAIEIARGKVHDCCLDPIRSTVFENAWSFHDMWVILIVTDDGRHFYL